MAMQRSAWPWVLLLGGVVACGARSALRVRPGPGASSAGGQGAQGGGGQGGGGQGGGGQGGGGQAGEGGQLPCLPGDTMVCGSDVGECVTGLRYCESGEFGPCQGAIGPSDETCNGLDDNCDGTVDDGFGLGQACDGPDTDLCLDDVMTCAGCSVGPNTLETCNGVDDNCNSIIDADCDSGDCQPKLTVLKATPSNPSCIDFPVEAGSKGTIEYPCTGGPVSATLGSIEFTGSVKDGQVSLSGTHQQTGPDGCWWKMDHSITGWIPSGKLTYFYNETLLDPKPGCWQPCTETGDVEIDW